MYLPNEPRELPQQALPKGCRFSECFDVEMNGDGRAAQGLLFAIFQPTLYEAMVTWHC